MRIGITVGLASEDEGLWVNGIKLNALYLAELLSRGQGLRVSLVNTTGVATGRFARHAPPAVAVCHLDALFDRAGHVDVLIVLGGAISQQQQDRLQQGGTRVVWYRCGSEYIASVEAAIFGRPIGGRAAYPEGADALWMIPQVADGNRAFYETLFRRPAKVVPFVWSPTWLERQCAGLLNDGRHVPGRRAQRLSIFEPNVDVIKFCYFPLFAAEQLFRRRPEAIELVSVTNSGGIRGNEEFISVVSHLDLVRQRKCFFEDRFELPWFLAHHTDVVVCHQMLNPLNYLYLDAAWLGYPVVHNAELCQSVGFYFRGNSLDEAVQALDAAVSLPERDYASFYARQREAVQAYSARNPALLQTYEAMLHEVMEAR